MFSKACYKGYINAVTRFLDYSKNTRKNLIEQRTIDDFKTTPIMIAALGGHLELIDELVRNGADLTVRLDNTRHGLVEIAAIRQDYNLLAYLHDKFTDMPKRLRDLMVSEKLEENSRATLGRTIEHYSENYFQICERLNESSIENSEEASLSVDEKIAYSTIHHADFGACLANYIRLCVDNENALASGVIILINTLFDDQIRKAFLNTRGIQNVIFLLEKNKLGVSRRVEHIINKLKNNKSVDEFEVEDLFGREDADKDIDDSEETYLECASIGQALSYLTKYDDCLVQINADGSNDKILSYTKLLFDASNLMKIYTLDKMFKERSSGDHGESMKMKIFNIINMGKKKKNARKLTPTEVFSQFESIDSDKKPVIHKNDSEDSEYEEAKAELIAAHEEAARKARQITFERFITPYIACVGNLAYQNSINKFTIKNLNLFELIVGYWEQLMYVVHKKNHRMNYIIIESIMNSLMSLYSFKIEKVLFEHKNEDSDAQVRNLIKPFQKKFYINT